MSHRRTVAAALLAAAILSLGMGSAPAASAENIDRPITGRTFIDVSEKVLPAVVSLDVRVRPSDRLISKFNDPAQQKDPFALWRRLSPEDWPSFGSGSGVVIKVEDGWGYVLTNRHVLDENERVEYTVKLDAEHFPKIPAITGQDVEVVGSDELTDIAVLRFRLPDDVKIEAVGFADSDKVDIGEFVVALGNPLELNNSVSVGNVSARNRDISDANRIERLLQTTAVINPGNSGGPLVNLDGAIVGINNAIATNTGQWSGVGFAIPSNTAKRVSELLIRDGRISRGFLGITMIDSSDGEGVSVSDVTPATPAAAAGVEIGDIVIKVDGKEVDSSRQLLAEIGNRFAGDEITLALLRRDADDFKDMSVTVKLAERPSEEVLISRQRLMQQLGPASKEAEREMMRLGISAEPDSDGRSQGMRVTRVEPGGPAGRAGIRAGDVIVQANGLDTTSEPTLLESLANVQEGKAHVILFRREGSNQFVTIDRE